MWRTDFIFQWRDRLVRTASVEVLALSQLIPSAPHALPQPHVILTQGVPPNSYAVLISACGTGQLQIHNRQFAHLLPGRIVGKDITRPCCS